MKRGVDFSRPDGMIFGTKDQRVVEVQGRWWSGPRARACRGVSRGGCDDGVVLLDVLLSGTAAPKFDETGAPSRCQISLKPNRFARELPSTSRAATIEADSAHHLLQRPTP